MILINAATDKGHCYRGLTGKSENRDGLRVKE